MAFWLPPSYWLKKKGCAGSCPLPLSPDSIGPHHCHVEGSGDERGTMRDNIIQANSRVSEPENGAIQDDVLEVTPRWDPQLTYHALG